MIFTKKKRKELALLKWELIVEENFTYDEFIDYIDGTPKPKYKELWELEAHCSFCEEFANEGCERCPLNKKEYEYEDDEEGYVEKGTCTSSNHPWLNWSEEEDDKKRLEYARTILKIIQEY
jgi:hypothetical protein